MAMISIELAACSYSGREAEWSYAAAATCTTRHIAAATCITRHIVAVVCQDRPGAAACVMQVAEPGGPLHSHLSSYNIGYYCAFLGLLCTVV